MQYLEFHQVSFSYDAMTMDLIKDLSVTLTCGWTGVVGANGTGKTTILKLATGALAPDSGHISRPSSRVYCPQRTDKPSPALSDLLTATDNSGCKIKGKLGIKDDWLERWDTLSHGERKRSQIATALWQEPDLLAIDEPTNHLDSEAKRLLSLALESFRGIGLVVSHDRDLLDSLCQQCLFVDPPNVSLYPGGFSAGSRQKEQDEQYQSERQSQAKRELKKLKQQASRRRDKASRSHQMRSKKGISAKDHDAKSRKDAARVSGKDGQAGRLLKQMAGRLRQASDDLSRFTVKKHYDTGIWLQSEKSKRNTLLELNRSEIELGEGRRLSIPPLFMRPADRIAITGVNGAGKSTFVKYIIDSLTIPRQRLTYVPQEIDLPTSQKIMADARSLADEKLGKMMTLVSRLGSRPTQLLESRQPSPGEIRKVMLAIGIVSEPHLIIMDEPTNHLDLASIECLESALSDCPCGLLLVSHDRQFLDRLTSIEWHLTELKQEGNYLLQVAG